MNKNLSLAIHGGAGTLLKDEMTTAKEKAYKETLQHALQTSYALLEGGTALDAVENAVKIMEDSPLFNAGKGSVFAANGIHQMEASIMEGKKLTSGAVALVTGVKNPIQLARNVMEKSAHVFLAGEGAMEFAREQQLPFENEAYFYEESRFQQWQKIKNTNTFKLDHDVSVNDKVGTVGAVALDCFGNLAAATSTGGMTNKKNGRIGDTALIGAGNYANNKTCAVSCTGSGEYFIRKVVAYDVSCLMEFSKMSLEEATHEVIHKRLLEIGGDGGLIAIDHHGNISMPFNTEGMYRACKSSNGEERVAIYKD
ncbi:isoaspartyl peptidase/L-asparaginase family protein [Mesonia maritima]|uniref:isoaspartyl peptidase/L-asparaginase family protein n=1 Tax=Mesonia maritima TaxID=1793873 RepID=UPI00362A6AC9